MSRCRLAPAIALVLSVACTRAARQGEFDTVARNEAQQRAVYTAQDTRVRVRRASIEVEVPEVAPAVERATKLAQDVEGYVENVMTTGQGRPSMSSRALGAPYRGARLARSPRKADAVAAQGELARVQGELDSLEGHLKALQSSVALSELTLTLNRRTVLGPLGFVISGPASLVGKLFIWR